MNKWILLCALLGQAGPAMSQSAGQRVLPDTLIPARALILGVSSLAAYGGLLRVLSRYWYQNYTRTHFHFFDDDPEWLQMDKAGHAFTAYTLGNDAAATWQWTGMGYRRSVWIGGLSGLAYQTIVEVLDGYSSEWGFSRGDLGADFLGAGMFITGALWWHEQRIVIKVSFHPVGYGHDPVLLAHTRDLFGTSLLERTLKDYNGQTYWMSANLRAFFPGSGIPSWLNLAVGMGAENMFAGRGNWWQTQTGSLVDYRGVRRVRQFYLAPDIDLTRIHSAKRGVRLLLQVLNMIKIPAPALEITDRGKIKVYGVYF